MSARLLLSELSRLGRNVDDVLANVRLCKDNHLNVYFQKEHLSIFDADGKYFPDRYFLDSYDEPLYFETIGEAAECVEEIVGHPVEATTKAIDEALDEYVEEHEDEDVFYSFHEFKIVTD